MTKYQLVCALTDWRCGGPAWHELSIGKVQCPICQKYFCDMRRLQNHLRRHSNTALQSVILRRTMERR